jgi:glucans biosynthesis protein
MPSTPTRRDVVKLAGCLTGYAWSSPSAWAETPLRFGPAEPFSFEVLKERARQASTKPFRQPVLPRPDIVSNIDYDAWGAIHFRPENALWADGKGGFPVTFFHLGQWFPRTVSIHAVENGLSREVIYDRNYFDMPPQSPAWQLPSGSGFAGFRFQEATTGALDWRKNDWLAFLGASFFRAIGELAQYGLSARGVAVNTTVAGKAEEFPDFTSFYIERASGNTAILYALLDGPSITGAYKFLATRTSCVVMDIEAALFLRAPVERLGIAPLTSMYWFSETVKPSAVDWRPEVHDSDGLVMWTGKGERLWRPLNDPLAVSASAFIDENPKGFGLMQRDRVFDHYLDGVYYDRRPSLWVEPIGDWGRGSVQLIEIPTDDEIHDNIVAMWVPEGTARAGMSFDLRYRLHWRADEPYPGPLARCVATRLGKGGQPGQPRPPGVRKFTVEFLGGPLESLPYGAIPEPVLWSSRGSFTDYRITEAVPDGVAGHWRTEFDLVVTGPEPVDMRLYLRLGEQALTETWLFQYRPF